MATLIPAAGEAREIAPADGQRFSLAELQAMVGGYIEALRAPDGRWLFLNEDGKRLELPVNAAVTQLMALRLQPGDYIVGDVIICNRIEAGEEA